MKLLVTLIGLMLILEAVPYVLFPEAMQRWLFQLSQARPGMLRFAGLAALGLGLLLCYLTQRTNLLS